MKAGKSTAKASKRAVKARKHAVTASKKAVKGKKPAPKVGKLPVKVGKLPVKGKQPPVKAKKPAVKPKKLTAKQLAEAKRLEANAKRRALYAEKKEAEAKAKAAEAKKQAAKASKQRAKAEKQRVKAEGKQAKAKEEVSRLLDRVRQLENEKAALAELVKVPTEKPKRKKRKRPPAEAPKKPANRVYVIGVADPRGYSEGEAPEEKRTRIGGKGNKYSFNYAAVFENVFRNKTRHLPYASDEIPIYRFGVTVRVGDVQNVSAAIQDLTEWLNVSMPAGYSANIVKEDDSFTVSLNLGDYKETSNSAMAVRELKKHSDLIAQVVDRSRSYSEDSDDFMWFPHWDWDSEYDSIEKSP